MITTDWPAPPASTRATLEEEPEGIRLTLPAGPASSSVFWAAVLLLACAVGLVGLAWQNPNRILDTSLFVLLLVVATILTLTGLHLLLGMMVKGRPTIVHATRERLCVTVPALLRTQFLEWSREEITGLHARYGIWIASAEDATCFYSGRDLQELRWIAAVLLQALDLPGELQPEYDTVPISYMYGNEIRIYDGTLYTRNGEMIVRPVLPGFPRVQFRPGPSIPLLRWYQRFSADPYVRLAAEEITCRVGEDGTTSLEIAPYDRPLSLMIWSPDPEGMQRSLARFLGSAEEFWCKPSA